MPVIGLSIIVPCYQEEEVIASTCERLVNLCSRLISELDTEVIFINDGSSDGTGKILRSFADSNPSFKVISFSRNFGHQAAVAAGLHHCSRDTAVSIDADLQDPPEIIPDMIKLMNDTGANVVYGVRSSRQGESWLKKSSAHLFYRLINRFSDVHIPVDTGDFRLMDRKVIDAFRTLKEKNKYVRGLVSWVGFNQVPFYYKRDERLAGNTKYGWSKMMGLGMNALTYFSKRPLHVAINLGFLCLFIGLLLAVYALVVRLSGDYFFMAGWASTMIAIIFFGGVQLLTVGLIGKYIGSIFDEVKQRPEYIIDETINFSND
ncbi:MAG: glycosyltransferase family 2 protein [Flavobacteriales bacterium]|nr:glycosyltransferase family 2 protein [Flavobacteriales bacterium]